MRVLDKPLPGDLVIRRRQDGAGLRRSDVWILTYWPDADTNVGGPYQSYNYAFEQAVRRKKDASILIWRDHAKPGKPEVLEQVG